MSEELCDCCKGDVAGIQEVENQPGLSSVAYRIGTHSSFLSSMQLHLSQVRTMDALTSRDASDPTMGLLDAWASTLDVLTFYQEKIANETYLRTATEELSVYELGKEVGYELAPATAATVYLAFTCEDAVGAPESVKLAVGTKAQSIPGQDELPQLFETVEEIVAYPELNQLAVNAYAEETIVRGATSAYLVGDTAKFRVGDTLMFDAATPHFARITSITADTTNIQTNGQSWVTWDRAIPSDFSGLNAIRVMGRLCAMFGYNAAPYAILSADLKRVYPANEWADQNITTNSIYLDASYADVATGAKIVFTKVSGSTVTRVVKQITEVSDTTLSKYLISGKTTVVTLDSALTTSNAITPMNASVMVETAQLTLGAKPILTPWFGSEVLTVTTDLLDEIEAERRLLVVGKAMRVQIISEFSLAATERTAAARVGGITTYRVASVTEAAGFTTLSVIVGDETYTLPAILATSFNWIDPTDDDPTVSALVSVSKDQTAAVSDQEIVLNEIIEIPFHRSSTVVYANVAKATHGETKEEILGSGDGTKSYQDFTLRGKPVTFLAAATTTGYANTLSVAVDGITWTEASEFLEASPRDRVYTIKQNFDQSTTVEFGDGKYGARLPTGVENVVATYRQGAGVEGNVRAEQIQLLQSRPLGLRSVINPMEAEGGSDAEDVADAQRTIPSTILSLGRIVSLQDYEDHAMRYPGVYKALVQQLWKETHQVVFLTVLGADGGAVDLTTLQGSIAAARESSYPLTLRNGDVYNFRLTVSLLVRAEYDQETVTEAVRAQLLTDYGFDAQEFGAQISASEVLASIHQVAGVEAAVVTNMSRKTGTNTAHADPLNADFAVYRSGTEYPASMLLLLKDDLTIEEMPREA
jgi:hypothetical protein